MRGLKYHRITNDLTQDQVAEHLGISQSVYSKKERGGMQLREIEMIKLAKLYNVKLEQLL